MNLPEPHSSQPPVDPRVGFAERDAAVDKLQHAAAEGRITVEELEERVAAALQARTQSDLLNLLVDLPGGDALFQPDTAGAPGFSPDDPLQLSAGWDRERRDGKWTIPPWIVINSGFGDVKLDCRIATWTDPVITVQIIGGMGEVTFIVPEGWAANMDRLQAGWGSKKSKVPTEPEFGKPLLRFEGSTGMSSVTVRPPSRWDRKLKEQ